MRREKIDNGDGILMEVPTFIDGGREAIRKDMPRVENGVIAVTGSDLKQLAFGIVAPGCVCFMDINRVGEPRWRDSRRYGSDPPGHLVRAARWKAVNGLRAANGAIRDSLMVAFDVARILPGDLVREKPETRDEAVSSALEISSAGYFFVGYGYNQITVEEGHVIKSHSEPAFVVAKIRRSIKNIDNEMVTMDAPGGLNLQDPRVLYETSVLCSGNSPFGLAVFESPEIRQGVYEWLPFPSFPENIRPQVQLTLSGGWPPVEEFQNLAKRGLQRR